MIKLQRFLVVASIECWRLVAPGSEILQECVLRARSEPPTEQVIDLGGHVGQIPAPLELTLEWIATP